jgi:hypothetical protein
MAAPTILHRRVGRRTIAIVHRPVPMAKEDWADLIASVTHIGETEGAVYYCVRTEGAGGPDASMRAELNEVGQRFPIRAAVITSSRIAKGIAMAVSWLGTVKIKAFAPADMDAALGWLETPASEHDDLKATLRTLEYRLEAERAS